MPDEPGLRDKAREAILQGSLPRDPADAVWGGLSRGTTCAACEQPILPQATELELEYVRQDDIARKVTYHLHPRCFAAWEFERTKTGRSHPARDEEPSHPHDDRLGAAGLGVPEPAA